jgi:hypothetical protein
MDVPHAFSCLIGSHAMPPLDAWAAKDAPAMYWTHRQLRVYAADYWFERRACHCAHYATCWEDDDHVAGGAAKLALL